MSERVVDRGSLEPAMGHAVVASGVAAHAVLVPRGVFHQGLEAARMPFVGEQVTRPLPTEEVVGWSAPRCALIGLIARQEIQEQPGVIERPARARAAQPRTPPALEYLAEQALAGAAPEEDILPRRVVVAVAGRDGDAFDTERHRLIEEGRHVVGILAAEERAVDGDPEAFGARELDRRDRFVEHALLTDR